MLGEPRKLLRADPRHQQHELVAVGARQHAARREQALQALGDGQHHRIANGMAEVLIDLLELIEIDGDDAERRSVRLGLLDEIGKRFAQRDPVGQAGQGIGACRALGIRLALQDLARLLPSPTRQYQGERRQQQKRDRQPERHSLHELPTRLILAPGERADVRSIVRLHAFRRLVRSRATLNPFELAKPEVRAELLGEFAVEILDGDQKRGRGHD